MPCPICGEICRCVPESRPDRLGISGRFQPGAEVAADSRSATSWVDPEAFDASEQQFAASLEESTIPQPQFVVERETTNQSDQDMAPSSGPAARQIEKPQLTSPVAQDISAISAEPSIFLGYQDPALWRQELAAKLSEYRSRRRPRAPRYPSLQLKFEAAEPDWTTPSEVHGQFPATRQSAALDQVEAAPAPDQEPANAPVSGPQNGGESAGRVIEFPRPSSLAPGWLDELAGPVMERPRILEVPDAEPPQPALGGILMEPVPEFAQEKRPGIEMPMLATPMWRRVLAAMVDGALVAAAVALFGYIFIRLTGLTPPLRLAAATMVFLTAFFWIGYQYLLLVHSGTTPGLKLAGLELSRFDGNVVARKLRRWRVLASVLSGASLCLGYAWCFLDEDQLCWHDRITRTYMAPKP